MGEDGRAALKMNHGCQLSFATNVDCTASLVGRPGLNIEVTGSIVVSGKAKHGQTWERTVKHEGK